MRKLWIDIETYSSVELKSAGVYRYAASPDFQILMAAWSDDGVQVHVALGEAEVLKIPGLFDEDVIKVAHNATFERICFSHLLGMAEHGAYLPPEQYHDTQALAGEHGFPQKLEKLAKELGGEQKDTAGTRLINLFCKPNRKGRRTLPEDKPMEWLDFIAYCEQDVYTLIDCDRMLDELGGWPNEMERLIYMADQRINDRGVAVDLPMAWNAVRVGAANEVANKARVVEISGGEIENPKSVQQMKKWIDEQLPAPLANLKAETVSKVLLDPGIPDDVREVLTLRKELALAAPAKFQAALNSHVEGRMQGTLQFFGAHTGRWAGRRIQLQNLPRAGLESEAHVDAAILDLDPELGTGASNDTLKRLVRPMFIGPFAVVDYAAIEARVIAWLAEEEWALQAFRDGRDIYVETAERMGGLSRAQGKIAVLALGYGGGAGSLKGMAGDDDRLPSKPDGSERELGDTVDIPEEEAQLILDATDDEILERFVWPWREANSKIVRFWTALERALEHGGAAGPLVRFECRGADRLMWLPSGRAVVYRKVQKGWKIHPRSRRKVADFTFASPQIYPARMNTYSGRLAENVTQAVARDVMAEALVRLEDRGYHPVVHVHDEILVETEDDWRKVRDIMVEPPAWSEGLPIDGEGFNCYRYRKG